MYIVSILKDGKLGTFKFRKQQIALQCITTTIDLIPPPEPARIDGMQNSFVYEGNGITAWFYDTRDIKEIDNVCTLLYYDTDRVKVV